jgi:hypothetical protein
LPARRCLWQIQDASPDWQPNSYLIPIMTIYLTVRPGRIIVSYGGFVKSSSLRSRCCFSESLFVDDAALIVL